MSTWGGGRGGDELAISKAFLRSFTVDSIPKADLVVQYSRSSGPGGQNVNKVSTKVDMRLTLADAHWIPAHVRAKLEAQQASKINKRGELQVVSDRFRTQAQNHDDCLGKLHALIAEAAVVPEGPSAETVARVAE
ncbi:hypothetical protein HK105_208544 [Polyrhizophydium stewartii]|uniref:Prokaryotic-type class I peptide chain release factors domain-containing protein n=1 Tax=Polyrhizophydium stewartii TaxID=2732419 RepID=A0ABR4MXG3_9FUNG|nr:Peptidyl-tRNA hydrolase ict1, mitochondrial [Polyrhizophydium stewartii]